jgi:hypothetical protein
LLKTLIASILLLAATLPVRAESSYPTSENVRELSTLIIAQKTPPLCTVVGIKKGQLALRVSPGGKAIAGLDNGNTVTRYRRGSKPWVYVIVEEGPNSRVNGKKGWVNSNFLSCDY